MNAPISRERIDEFDHLTELAELIAAARYGLDLRDAVLALVEDSPWVETAKLTAAIRSV